MFSLRTTAVTVATGVSADSSLGQLFKRITTQGQFVRFDKDHSDRFFFKDQSSNMTVNVMLGASEMDCFLANHTHDDLRLEYNVYDRTTVNGHERLNYATRIVSLKTGDDTKNWADKEQRDSSVARDHHEQLAKVRPGRLY